jgi:hypothetical protein
MHVYECKVPFSDIADYPLGGLLASWEEQRGLEHRSQRLLPGRGDFDLRPIRSLLGRINLLSVHRSPDALRFVWRRHGGEGVQVHGIDRTGLDTTTLNPERYRDVVERHYREVVDLRTPTLYEIESIFDHHQTPRFYRRLLLPFATDGHNVDMLLSAWDEESRSRDPVRM